MAIELPKRLSKSVDQVSNAQNYDNLKNINIDDYKKIDIVSVKYADIVEDPQRFMYYFKNLKNLSVIHCDCYECLMVINSLLEQETNIQFRLLDDGLQKDRSYIDLPKLDKLKNVSLPITYVMWNVELNDIQEVSCYTDYHNGVYKSVYNNGNKNITKNDLLKIKSIIESLKKDDNLTDVQKTLIISDYLQANVQYINEYGLLNKTGLIETVLFENYGICMGIANATTLLSNNPIFNLNTRTVFGSCHVWNLQSFNGVDYYIDNTFNITRNPNKFNGKLKAREFTTKYTMFGSKTSENLDSHVQQSVILRETNLSLDDFSKENLAKVTEELKQKQLIIGKY